MELNAEPVPTGVNVNGFFSVDSEDVVTGGVLGGLPKVKPTGLPMLPPDVPGVLAVEDAPNVNFVPVVGNPPNGDGTGLSLSEPVPPKRLVVDEDVEAPNPPNGLAGFSVLVLPNPLNALVVLSFSEVLDDPKEESVAVFPFSLSSLDPNTEGVDGPPNKPVVEEEDPVKWVPEDVELEVKFPNGEGGLGLSFGCSSVLFFAREEAKKFGIVEEGLLSVALPKPNVGAGGPPEESEAGAGVEGNVNPVDGFGLSVVVGGVKPLGFGPEEDVFEFADGFDPKVLGGMGVDSLGADVAVELGVFDKLGALNRIDGPGSGPSGSVFLGELLKEPVSCLSHTDWMARLLAAYWSKTWERSTKGSSLTAFVRKVTIEWFKPRMLL